MSRRSRSEGDMIRQLSAELQRTEDPFTFARLAELLLNQGRLLEARSVCEQCIARYPDYTTARVVFAQVCEAQGDVERQEAELRAVIAAEPHNRVCRVALGRLLVQRGAVAEAREHLEHALFLAPGDATARNLLAQACGQEPVPFAAPQVAPAEPRERPVAPLQRALDLLIETEAVEGAIWVDGSGLAIGSRGQVEAIEDQLSANAHETWQLAKTYVVRMDLGALQHATLLGERATFIVAPAKPGLLVVATQPKARLGLINMQIEAARNLLARL